MEKQLYENLSLTDFVQRLLVKRCVSFVGPWDYYKLLSGKMGYGSDYPKIGTDQEVEPFLLKSVISYDEVKVSPIIFTSSLLRINFFQLAFSFFILDFVF